MSSALPGGTGSTILMGLFGYLSCASAGAALIEAAAIRAAHKKRGTLSSIDYARAKRSSADDPHQWGWESLATNCAMVAGPFQPDVVWVEDLQACRRAISKARNAAGVRLVGLGVLKQLLGVVGYGASNWCRSQLFPFPPRG